MKPVKRKDQEDGTRFVRLVKKHPCLYDYNLPEYSQRDAIDSAWKKIASEMHCDAKTLREKWRNYRTVFLRRCKAEKEGKTSRSSYYLDSEMRFLLDFVKVAVPFKRNIASTSLSSGSYTIVMPQDESQDMDVEKTDLQVFQEKLEYEYEDSTVYNTSTATVTPKKQHHQFNITAATDDLPVVTLQTTTSTPSGLTGATATPDSNNPRRLFLLSIAPELDKMTDKQFRRFRKTCLDYLDDCIEDE